MANKALFLDRDGVINFDRGYVYRIEDFEFLPGIFEFCRVALDKGYKIFVITNQSGIGRGYFTESDFKALTDWMLVEFTQRGISITQVYYCPHHPEHGLNTYQVDCDCRKPKPGLLLRAMEEHSLSAKESVFVGDKESDLTAASAARVQGVKVATDAADFRALAALLL
jgi:D-glycero-D-manno-heptose 1,7-bisphosphate phosphatase